MKWSATADTMRALVYGEATPPWPCDHIPVHVINMVPVLEPGGRECGCGRVRITAHAMRNCPTALAYADLIRTKIAQAEARATAAKAAAITAAQQRVSKVSKADLDWLASEAVGNLATKKILADPLPPVWTNMPVEYAKEYAPLPTTDIQSGYWKGGGDPAATPYVTLEERRRREAQDRMSAATKAAKLEALARDMANTTGMTLAEARATLAALTTRDQPVTPPPGVRRIDLDDPDA